MAEPSPTWLRIGAYTHPELDADVPLLLELPSTQTLVIESAGRHDEAVGGIQSLLLRIAAALPPGAVRFTVIDPKGLGQSVAPLLGLSGFDADLIDGGVATTPDEIEARLASLTHHAERVVTQYLRGTHRSLADYHAAAGEIVEPYRVLVVLDHPSQLNEGAVTQLTALAENGPRSGVQTIIVKDPTPSYSSYQAQPPTGSLSLRLDGKGYFLEVTNAGRWTVRLDPPPPSEIVDRIIDGVGAGAARQHQHDLGLGQLYALADRVTRTNRARPGEAPVAGLDPEDPATWWTGRAADAITVPIGRHGAADVATLELGPTNPGWLVVGPPGSGVSSLLHTAILGLALRYDPDEVELHLIGMGSGRELLGFGELGLPHAVVVASGADQEFGVGSLEAIWDEVERRQELIADTVGERAGYHGFRAARPDRLPRLVAVVERVGDLFDGPRRKVQRAGELLDSIARYGPPCGVHVVLTTSPDDERTMGGPDATAGEPSSTALTPAVTHLRGVAALDVITLGPGPGLAADADGGATELDGLQIVHRPGDATMRHRASTAGPAPFRGALVDPGELTICLHDLRRMADARQPGGAANRPQVHDGHAVARVEQRNLLDLIGDPNRREARRMPRLWLGDPIGTGPPIEAVLHRRDGANLLAVTPDPDLGQGVVISAMLSALLVHGENLGVLALDFMPPEAGFTEATKVLAGSGWTVQLARRRNISKVVDIIHRVVQDRLATSETRAKPVLFVMNGLSRARDLAVATDGETHPDDEHLLGIIEAVLRDGPEVGVHTLAWSESIPALNRRLPKSAVREFALPRRRPHGGRRVDGVHRLRAGRHPAPQRGPVRRRGLGPAREDGAVRAALDPVAHHAGRAGRRRRLTSRGLAAGYLAQSTCSSPLASRMSFHQARCRRTTSRSPRCPARTRRSGPSRARSRASPGR